MSQQNGTITYDPHNLLGYGSVIFHHLPNEIAYSYQATLICSCVCAGVLGLELVSNLDYDWALARRTGWKSWSKCQNRLAYYMSRYGSLTYILLTIVYTVAPDLDCAPYAIAIEVMWLLPVLCVDFIFMQRTLALYTGNKGVCTLLYSFYLMDIALAICAVVWYGFGYHIPASNFCAYYTENKVEPHGSVFIAYCVLTNTFDTVILTLTLHRLVDGGLFALPRNIKASCIGLFDKDKKKSTLGVIRQSESISALLLRQGLHYYAILEVVRLVYIVVYYTTNGGNSTYQILCTALLATIGPLLANRLFRETSEFVRSKTVIRSNQDHTNQDFPDRNNNNNNNNNNNSNNMEGNSMKVLSSISPFSSNSRSLHHQTKSSYSWEDDEEKFRGVANTTRNNANNQTRRNTSGLKIHVSENRISSFIDDYQPKGIARLLPLHHRDGTNSPPLTSRTLVNKERPFHDTLSLQITSPPTSPEKAAPTQPPNSSFDIRVKRPDSQSPATWL